ncbi:hypothetical protein PsorP6_018096 [Peronosclerospora sorghi]|uniref:Uncharacterized protein n=1 Tax=Peronosclerospora sorghi TaxID=230839 RepID=A0ACC0WDL8_9STRA|nr:hypothetical protein PsorP6_018096 [Peronosclerospora sorghi]
MTYVPPTSDDAPAYSAAQVDNCAFAAWYPKLKHVSIKGVVVPLPSRFISLLLADGVTLPSAVEASKMEPVDAESDGGTRQWTSEDVNAISIVQEQVEQALEAFRGKTFAKTNWSAPRDAAWMLGTLQCTSFEDVFLLLQASDFVVHDLTQPYSGCKRGKRENGPQERYLVLKQWCNFLDSMLFRCFVIGHRLVAVSQRNCHEFYDFLVDQQEELCDLLTNFYATHFRNRGGAHVFPDPNYCFDVYIDKRRRVYLLDINVFGGVTDTLLFSWKELVAMQVESCAMPEDSDDQQCLIDFRVVESKTGIRANPLSGYRAPTDLVDHLVGGAGFDAFMEQVKCDNAPNDDSDRSDGEH